MLGDRDMIPEYRDKEIAAPILVAPTTRLTASVNSEHVVAAFELADT
jgi:hypothetical protein